MANGKTRDIYHRLSDECLRIDCIDFLCKDCRIKKEFDDFLGVIL